MAGLVPAIHAAPPQRGFRHRAAMSKGFQVFSCLPSAISTFNVVDGRDKPGHDPFKALPGGQGCDRRNGSIELISPHSSASPKLMDADRHSLVTLVEEIRACRICRDARRYGAPLPHQPRPVFQVSPSARICIAGQAPGVRVHASGHPYTDPSGVRLRSWLGIGEDVFHDPKIIAVVAMGFCFPGLDAKGGDLPPRRECAELGRIRPSAFPHLSPPSQSPTFPPIAPIRCYHRLSHCVSEDRHFWPTRWPTREGYVDPVRPTAGSDFVRRWRPSRSAWRASCCGGARSLSARPRHKEGRAHPPVDLAGAEQGAIPSHYWSVSGYQPRRGSSEDRGLRTRVRCWG
jgi:Uracil DNA glycosylase superfamily